MLPADPIAGGCSQRKPEPNQIMCGISDNSLIQIANLDLDLSVCAGHWTKISRVTGSCRQDTGGGTGGMARATQEGWQGHLTGRLHVSGAVWRADGFEQLSSSRPAQAGRGTGAAEADVPGHPRTIAMLGKTKGHVKDIQGIMRHTKVSTTTDVYMQSLEPKVRTAINSIYDELVGNGTDGPTPDGPGTAATVEHAETTETKPARVWFWNLRQGCDKLLPSGAPD